jgi:hypothetical protein
MKKLLTIAVFVVAIVGFGGLSVAHYKNYQNKHKVSVPATITVQAANQEVSQVKAVFASEKQDWITSYDQAVAECQKGVAAYGKLTHYQQSQTQAPVCPNAQ